MGWIDPPSGRRVMIEKRGESCVAVHQLPVCSRLVTQQP
jgi:hypothetical protein